MDQDYKTRCEEFFKVIYSAFDGWIVSALVTRNEDEILFIMVCTYSMVIIIYYGMYLFYGYHHSLWYVLILWLLLFIMVCAYSMVIIVLHGMSL